MSLKPLRLSWLRVLMAAELTFALMVVGGLWLLRQQTLNGEARMLDAVAEAMARQADRTIATGTVVLRTTSDELSRGLLSPSGREIDAHGVDQAVLVGLAARHDAPHVRIRVDDSFGEQEADREVRVVAGRAHRDRHVFFRPTAVGPRVTEPDAERLLGRHDVGGVARVLADAADRNAPHHVRPALRVALSHGLPF